MLKPPQPPNIITPPSPICADGLPKEPSLLNEVPKDNTGISSRRKIPPIRPRPLLNITTSVPSSSTQEFPQENKQEICSDKSPCCKNNSLPTPSLTTLVVESISKEKGLSPYWNTYSMELSKKLWLPTMIDSQGLDSNSSNGSLPNSTLNWSVWTKIQPTVPQTTSQTISWKSSPSLQPAITDDGNTEIMGTRKLRIYPTKIQKEFFSKYFGTHRYFYNKAINEINTHYEAKKKEFKEKPCCLLCTNPKQENSFLCETHKDEKIPWNSGLSFISLRNLLVKSKAKLLPDEQWQNDIPYDTREAAVKEAVTNFKSCVTNLKHGNIDHFHLRFKKRENPTRHFCIDDRAIKIKNKQLHIFVTKFKENSRLILHNRGLRSLPEKFKNDVKILFDRGAYYLVISSENPKPVVSNVKKTCISLDPGERHFQTGYSDQFEAYVFGKCHRNKMKKLHEKISIFQGLLAKTDNKKTKRRLKNKLARLERQLRANTRDLHNQTNAFLAKNYKHILLPKFETQSMVQRNTLPSAVNHRLMSLSHYAFQQRLKHMCQKYKSNLYIVDESYTTQTCGKCGIRNMVGSDKIYKCSSCNYICDRDLHGARNIFIKNLAEPLMSAT